MSRNRLSELSRVEAAERGRAGAVCLLPVGSLEQHGEHLPVFTDSLLVETSACAAAALARADVLVAPPLWTGFSPHHLRLGATVTLEPELLLALDRETVRCLRAWFRARGRRQRPRRQPGVARRPRPREEGSSRELLGARRAVAPERALPVDLGSIGHAGESETSAMLAGRAGARRHAGPRVRADHASERPFLVPDMGASGVLGDPARRDCRRRRRSSDFVGTRLSRARRDAARRPRQRHRCRREERADRMTDVSRRRRLASARAAARPADGRVRPSAVDALGYGLPLEVGRDRARARRHARRPLRRRHRRDRSHPQIEPLLDRVAAATGADAAGHPPELSHTHLAPAGRPARNGAVFGDVDDEVAASIERVRARAAGQDRLRLRGSPASGSSPPGSSGGRPTSTSRSTAASARRTASTAARSSAGTRTSSSTTR